jgi:asparagine N-glycosylation enzyme membrane subunit Stt3
MLLDDEAATLDFWSQRTQSGERIRYVVLDGRTAFANLPSMVALLGGTLAQYMDANQPMPTFGEAYYRTIAARLYVGRGSGLGHYRLVYASPQMTALYYHARSHGVGDTEQLQVTALAQPIDSADAARHFAELDQANLQETSDGYVYRPRIVPSVQIFEIVPGATVLGTTQPGMLVEARLRLGENASDEDAALLYRQVQRADDQGHFALTLPYSTDGLAAAAVQPIGLYRILVGVDSEHMAGVVQVGVSEANLQAGSALDLGQLP